MNTALKGNCLIGQSGGPTSVINGSLYGIIKAARESDAIERIYGACHGTQGILSGNIIDLTDLSKEETELLPTTPSAALGSSRVKLCEFGDDDTDYRTIYELFRKYNIRYFFFIGGNDSMDTCDKISRYFRTVDFECRIFGVPKTIDNDLCGTDHCPGYGSAAKYVATTMLELYEDAAVYGYPQVVIVEIMGRNAGWLTASAALSRINGHGPDLVYLPEVPFSVGEFLNSVGDHLARDESVLVAVSEGVMDEDGVYITDYSAETKYIDTFGHIQMGGLGSMLKSMVINRFKAKTRSIELSLLQRCAGHIASKTDLDEAIMVGRAAVEYALEGKSGYMVGIKRVSNDPYASKPELLDLAKCANYENKVPLEWILPGGAGVTEEFIEYMKPLIQGEVTVPKKDSLPVYARLGVIE